MIDRLSEWGRRLAISLRRGRWEARVEEEIRFHAARAAEDLRAQGHSAIVAEQLAARRLGQTATIREEARDAWMFRQLEIVIGDLRYAWRSLRRDPGLAAAAIGVLAVGIGALTGVFSVANTTLFRPMPVADPKTLTWIIGTQTDFGGFRNLSLPEIRAIGSDREVFAAVAAYQDTPLSLGGPGGDPVRISSLIVTGNYFEVLGVPLFLGRGFAPEEDSVPGAHPVVVLGYRLWERRFGGDRAIIGKPVVINGTDFMVIGVARPGFVGAELESTPDVWVPLAMQRVLIPSSRDLLDNPAGWWLRAIGRLAPGATGERALASVRIAHGRLSADHPRVFERTGVEVRRLRGGIDPPDRSEALTISMLFLAIPGVVLLVACANVANLLLSRAVVRRREMGMRLALGAGRSRLTRQLLTESGLLGLLGGTFGVVLAGLVTRLMLRAIEAPPELAAATTIDWRVLSFAFVTSAGAGLLFGLAPAWGAAAPGLTGMLRGDFELGGGRLSGSRLMRGLVIGEIAACLMLLVATGLVVRSLRKSLDIDPGFESKGAAAVSFDLGLQGYGAEQRANFYRGLLERARQLPGVSGASIAQFLPLGDRQAGTRVIALGQPDDRQELALFSVARPGLLSTLGVRLLGGRDFSEEDRLGAPRVAIVNQTLARRLWPNTTAIGQQFRHPWDSTVRTVVGLIQDGKYADLAEESRGYLILSERQEEPASEMTLVARTDDDPGALAQSLREVLREMDPNLPLFKVETLSTMLRGRVDSLRGASKALAGFGAVTLVLAALGLYGVMAFAVTRRKREIGVRMALGASSDVLVRQLVGEGVRLAGWGLAIGLAASVAIARLLQSVLYGVRPGDSIAFFGAAGVLFGVALIASYLPARRGARVDPTVALRAD